MHDPKGRGGREEYIGRRMKLVKGELEVVAFVWIGYSGAYKW